MLKVIENKKLLLAINPSAPSIKLKAFIKIINPREIKTKKNKSFL